MPRYIDADLILPEMESKFDMQELYLPAHFQEFIVDEIPTADVAPVVRCKDCKNAWHSLEGLRCCIWATSEENCETEPDAFCSFGERKDNDND